VIGNIDVNIGRGGNTNGRTWGIRKTGHPPNTFRKIVNNFGLKESLAIRNSLLQA